ncbi:hypothetical protein [Acinetobacter junii]|uniref:hypothetical protein n=1 Tax=Acinetobacter junii TaxID=40215 RepID=UPI0030AAE2B6
MNANQFIKDHGVDKAREVVEGAPEWAMSINFNNGMYYSRMEHKKGDTFLYDIKRLVESVYLVKEHHTLDRAIEYANSQYTAPEIKVCLLDAIADYKSIYGGEHV